MAVHTTEQKNNPLFDTLKALFKNKEYINKLSEETCSQIIFMINRRLAIKYPLQAQAFNLGTVNAKDEIKYWSDFLYNNEYVHYVPDWIYTAGATKSKTASDNKKEISSKLMNEYSKNYNISVKDINTALRFFPNETIAEFKDFEELNKQN